VRLLRFDCFDNHPHYHYGPENHNIRIMCENAAKLYGFNT